MREYNMLTVLRSELNEDDLVKAVNRIRGVVNDNGGQVLKVEHMGVQKLAYNIKKSGQGTFVNFNYLAPPTIISEVERTMRIMDAYVRFQTSLTEREPELEGREGEAAESFVEQVREARRLEEELRAQQAAEAAAAEAAAEAEAAERQAAQEAREAAAAAREAAAQTPAEPAPAAEAEAEKPAAEPEAPAAEAEKPAAE